MGLLSDVRLRQPARDDLVGDRFLVAGLGAGFEGTIGIRVLGPGGRVLAEDSAQSTAGGVGVGEFSARVRLPRPPRAGTRLTVQVFGDDPSGGPGPGSDVREVEVVFFPDIRGYLLYRVERGDTLTGIVREAPPLHPHHGGPGRRGESVDRRPRRHQDRPAAQDPAQVAQSRSGGFETGASAPSSTTELGPVVEEVALATVSKPPCPATG